jgi:cytochrome P450
MQAMTLDVIMAGIFGIEGGVRPGTLEYKLKETLRGFLRMSTRPFWAIVELQNMGHPEPRGLLRMILSRTDKLIYEVIRQRRAAGGGDGRDVLSLLLEARDEEGEPLSDPELRDELATLVLAGHETTANSLAWTFERLVRTPDAYNRLREVVRSGEKAEADAYVDATIYEGMRARPVIPMVVRLVQRPWRLGPYVVPPRTPVALSIVGVQHREDVYPEPYAFRPERFLDKKPGTYTWIPFGGGIRRCLGASLAMAEQQLVLSAIARRTDLVAADPRPERGRQRNVTMIPGRGGEVVLQAKL